MHGCGLGRTHPKQKHLLEVARPDPNQRRPRLIHRQRNRGSARDRISIKSARGHGATFYLELKAVDGAD